MNRTNSTTPQVTRQSVSDSVKIRHFIDANIDADDCSFTTITQPFELSKSEFELLEAARTNNASQLQTALKLHKVNVNTRNNLDRTALHWAAANGHANIIRLLLQAKADLNFADKYGMTPLMWAACHGHVVIVEELMKAGAVTTIVNRQGLNALHCAALHAHDDVINSIGSSVDVNTFCQESLTALHIAADKGYSKVVTQLLALNCDVNLKNKNGLSALHLAASAGHISVIRKLLRHDVEVDDADLNGTTALMMAAEHGHLKAVKALLQNKADPNEQNLKRLTPLMLAAVNGHVPVVSTLISQGCSRLNTYNLNKDTALHLAVSSDHVHVVKVLLDSGFDVNAINGSKQTALHIAAELGNPEMVDLLLTAGSQVDAKDKFGKTALMLATRANLTGIVDVIIKHERLVLISRETNRLSLQDTINLNNNSCNLSLSSPDELQQFDNQPFDEVDHNLSVDNEPPAVASEQLLPKTETTSECDFNSLKENDGDDLNSLSEQHGGGLNSSRELREQQWGGDDLSVCLDHKQDTEKDPVDKMQGCQVHSEDPDNGTSKRNVVMCCIVHDDDDIDSTTEASHVEAARYVEDAVGTNGERTDLDDSPNNTAAVHVDEPIDTTQQTLINNDNDDDGVFQVLEISVQAGVCRVRESTRVESVQPVTIDEQQLITTADTNSQSHKNIKDSPINASVRHQQHSWRRVGGFSLDECEAEMARDLELRYPCFYEKPVESPPPAAAAVDMSCPSVVSSTASVSDDGVETIVEVSSSEQWSPPAEPQEQPELQLATRQDMDKAMKEVLWKLATKQLKGDEWKKLARHWQFTEEHINAIQHNYSGSSSHRDHTFRMLSIWFQCQTIYRSDTNYNPVVDLFEALTAINRRKLAERIRRQWNAQTESTQRKACVIS